MSEGEKEGPAGSGQAAQQKAWVSEDAVLQRGERKLHRHCSQPHDFRRGALLHALKRVLMEVPRNVAPWAYGATGFECARATNLSSGCIHHGAIPFRELLTPTGLACRAAEGICSFVIDELG